ncbi:MAG: fibronectin type III domain-containing protein [Kofleriaceae bacterium]
MVGRFLVASLGLSLVSLPAVAAPGVCHVVDVQMQPEARVDLRPARNMPPQIVVWVEDTQGNFIDTVFITQSVGTYGLGNRPGRFDFNSAPGWPYGRRTTTFPVWATKKPERFDSIMFQDGNENNLSHAFNESSRETHFCRPLTPAPESPDSVHYDALTCASPNAVFTDKGRRVADVQSKYPPRQDMTRTPGTDSASVDTFRDMNPYDAISQATPAIGQLATIGWPLPFELATGDYVMFVEVSTEYDHNATYSEAARPGPSVTFADYGEPYRGQPSIVYRVPFTIADEPGLAQTDTYAGYGAPDGEDGDLRAPDATITTNVKGSGVGRLALVTDPDGTFRVRVRSRVELDVVVPNKPAQLAISALSSRTATLSFVAPGDDAVAGTVRQYEIRVRVGDTPFTADNFEAPDTIPIPSSIVPVPAGELQELEVPNLLPETEYTVGIRAIDDCKNISDVASIAFTTPARFTGEVDACFVATAAYGSALAADVTMLRHLRDSVLRKTVLGELFVESYYTFGPPVAGMVGESELLRATARTALQPIVSFVRR